MNSTGIGSSLFSVAICVGLSTFFSGAETALTALGEPRARQLYEKGHRSLHLWITKPERVLAALLIGNTIVNTLAAALFTSLVESLGAPQAVALSTGAVTLLILVFSEITPKTLARRYAVQLAPLMMPPVVAIYYLLIPATWVLSAIPRRVNKFLTRGRPAGSERTSITSEDIEYLIDFGAREGVLDREKSKLLTRVLEFSDTVTREIMVPRLNIVALSVDSTRDQVVAMLLDSQHSRIPVFEESIDNVVGVLHVKTLLAELKSDAPPAPFELRSRLQAPLFVPELMKIGKLLREFQRRKMHLAVVVDEFGGTAGVVALEDVVEEIVGDIQDEYDVDEGRMRVLSDGTIIADGTMALRDLAEPLGVEFPEGADYDSLGGFLTATVGKVPPANSVVLWHGVRFTVRAGDERRVTRIEITKAPQTMPPPVKDKPA